MIAQILLRILLGFTAWAMAAGIALYVGWSEIFISVNAGIVAPFPNEKIVLSLICAFVSLVFAKIAADGIAELRIVMNW